MSHCLLVCNKYQNLKYSVKKKEIEHLCGLLYEH